MKMANCWEKKVAGSRSVAVKTTVTGLYNFKVILPKLQGLEKPLTNPVTFSCALGSMRIGSGG